MLAELTVEDVDAKRPGAPLFVRCRRDDEHADSKLTKAKKAGAAPLVVDVMEAQRVWQTRVTSADKPMALDCSSDEYLATLARAFSGADDSSTARFHFRWSRKARTLTLMEQTASGFAMKYAALTFVDQEDEQLTQYWNELLHSIVDGHASVTLELARREDRIGELEALVRDKDALLEQALDAKQHVEDALVDGFCAVLNAKKDEIQRLQSELAVADARASDEQAVSSRKTQSKKRKTAASTGVKRTRAIRGAKLKHQQQEEEESDEGLSKSSNDGDDSDHERGRVGSDDDADDDDDVEGDAGRKRARREAIGAYSQLPSSLRSTTQRICSSDDVLSGLDAIMKSEVEANEAEQQNIKAEIPKPTTNVRARKLPPSLAQQAPKKASSRVSKSVAPAHKAVKKEVKPPVSVTRTAVKPTAAAVDSEEEDILDIFG